MKTNSLLKIDMGISSIMVILVIFSTFSSRFSIFPMIDDRILGMNNFKLVLESISHVFAGFGIVLIYNTRIFYKILNMHPDMEKCILSVYQIKWGVFLGVNIIPYAFNQKPQVIFLIFHIIMFLLFIYKRVENDELESKY
ncbi:MAG: hypothetical protein QGF36_00145 [Candidatus Marinimicrobia bacterium]|jgi:hypothetical protein|nr:hypothetical protein [Candidatus Neomarinimicrobiota bacterium]MDP6853257.1 hypothetical protein [Candidatus Neomarinimicrobiota bacterium]MDP6935824.1 hypothetical protein [Candidatus Neomarinimicrobiota bacterium]